MLPSKLPYTRENIKKKITSFLGINLTETQKEGEFTDTLGLSSEKYPVLTQRKGRAKQTTYTNVKDIFEWDGKFVIVDGTTLYFDGVAITNVVAGTKQIAVVNTHLIVMPDKLDIDMTSEYYDDNNVRHFRYKRLGATMNTAAVSNGAIFSNGHDIKGLLAGYKYHFAVDRWWQFYDGGSGESARWSSKPCFYTYGTDRAAVEACWQNGQWVGLSALQHLKWVDAEHSASEQLAVGDILIPQKVNDSFKIVEGSKWYNQNPVPPDTTKYNNEGYYMVYTSPQATDTEFVYTIENRGYIEVTFGMPPMDLYSAYTQLFSNVFSVGDLVTCTNASSYNFTKAKITAIDNSTNTITVKSQNSSGVYDADPFPAAQQSFSTSVSFERIFPNLDFICEKGNRLCGVSNQDKTIYISGLGLPEMIYNFGDNDTDPYAVAVGSEGDFTGICSYGDAILCWKENTVHKVLGDYPSNFYTNEYKIAGVQKGSEKSLCVINETLLYKGVNGVFTYTGSTPSLISGSLGRDVYHKAVAGSDGNRYYISMTDDHHNPYLFTYDLVNGIWLKEDNLKADAFCKISGVQVQLFGGYYYEDQFYMVNGGYLYKLGVDNNEKFEWVAEFAPFYTYATASSSYTRSFGKQTLSKLTFQMEMEKGSRIILQIKEDNNPYRVVQIKSAAEGNLTTVMPIRVGRCDKIQVKIKGYGRVTIRGLERSYFAGSEA